MMFTSSERWIYFFDNDLDIAYGICVILPKERMRRGLTIMVFLVLTISIDFLKKGFFFLPTS